jgi:hypothetical protein
LIPNGTKKIFPNVNRIVERGGNEIRGGAFFADTVDGLRQD